MWTVTSIFWTDRYLSRVLLGLGLSGFVAWSTGHLLSGLVIWGIMLVPFLYQLIAPSWCARQAQTRAIWWTPAPPTWLQRQLPDPVPLGPRVWEVHAQDARRWVAPTPYAAAQAYRQTYAAELVALIADRPDDVALVSSGFNLLTSAEAHAIQQAGGRIWAGPLHPHLPRRYAPWKMAVTQRRMFGAVVSHKDRRDPALWVTWAIPARVTQGTASQGS